MRRAPSLRMLCALALCTAAAACSSGGGGSVVPAPPAPQAPLPSSTPAPTPAPAPEESVPAINGFDGGTQLVGFTGRPASVYDSIVREPPTRVWGALPGVFRTLGIETRTVEPATYTIGLESGRVARIEGGRLSRHLECGSGILGPNADNYDVIMTLLVQLAGHAGGGTLVRTTLDAYARPRSNAGEPIHCASSRTLELRVVELLQQELSGVRPVRTVVARGRVPVAGDHLRVECLSPVDPMRQVGEGRFLGTSGEQLLLAVGPSGASVGVPAGNVGSVQVREVHSRSKLVGLFGALAGATAGGLWGKSWYEGTQDGVRYRNGSYSSVHYGQGVYVTIGALGGGVAGYLLGRITGSFIHTDVWVDAPEDWALRFTGLDPGAAGAAGGQEPPTCPTFAGDE